MNSDYVLNFTIPQGPTGPTGPQGITGPTGPSGDADEKAIGYLWNTATNNVTFLANKAPLQVNLWNASLGLNVNYTTDGDIITQLAGGYQIEYCVVLQVPEASPDNVVTVSVSPSFNDDVFENFFGVTLNINSNSLYYFSNSLIRNLTAGEDVKLVISGDKVMNFNYSMSYLIINRMGEAFKRIPYN